MPRSASPPDRLAAVLRRSVNAVVVAGGLLVCLPLVTASERRRPGSGRSVALLAIRALARLCGLRLEVLGHERLDPEGRYVLVPNHTSPADIPAVLLARPDVRFLAAAELFRVPLLASTMRALGVLPVDRSDPAEAKRRIDAVTAAGTADSFVVFAEGGIVRRGERRPFKSGAFALAIASGAAVVPVSIRGAGDVLPPGSRFAVRPGVITVELHEPVSTDGLTMRDRSSLRQQTERVVRAALGQPA